MTNDFMNWLAMNGLSTAFVTSSGDALYANKLKGFGVIQKHGETGAHSFYFNDIVEIKTYDDENMVMEWNRSMMGWRMGERSTRHSSNEVTMTIRFMHSPVIKMRLFKAEGGNVERDSIEHVNLFNYACQITQIAINCATCTQYQV